jgi:hypothetical protein
VPVVTFTYVSEGADLEASFQPYAAGGRTYILWWQSRASEWDTGLPMRTTVLSTFRAPA